MQTLNLEVHTCKATQATGIKRSVYGYFNRFVIPTWREKRRAGIPKMMDVKLRKPQMARAMTERMRKLFGGGYWLGIDAPRGAVTSGCMGACMGVG